MMQKPWFKLFIWFISSAFFLLASGIAISELRPALGEQEAMAYMTGMMGAMENSLMGLSMSLEGNGPLQQVVLRASTITIPLALSSLVLALLLKLRRNPSD